MAEEEPTVVKAAMVSVNAGLTQGKGLAQVIEAAMSQAVTDALADGVSINDSDEIRSRMLAARQAVLDEVREKQAELAALAQRVEESS